jgi:hypothetical protein
VLEGKFSLAKYPLLSDEIRVEVACKRPPGFFGYIAWTCSAQFSGPKNADIQSFRGISAIKSSMSMGRRIIRFIIGLEFAQMMRNHKRNKIKCGSSGDIKTNPR